MIANFRSPAPKMQDIPADLPEALCEKEVPATRPECREETERNENDSSTL